MTEREFFDYFVYAWIFIGVVTFISLFFITAPYGRHTRKGWGGEINATAGWVIMELPSAILVGLFYFLSVGERGVTLTPLIFLIMWQAHYINRSLIFPFRRRGGQKTMPLLIMFSALFFNLANGYIQGRGVFSFSEGYGLEWLYDPRFIIGAALFAAGFAINQHSDKILFNLRKPGETGYKIPQGGLYRFVSSPNYFGEILEWIGWAIATWSLGGLSFAIWTIANLAPRARDHHRWYREKFAEYPRERKALIPFLY